MTREEAASILDPETSRETIWAIEAEGKDGLAYVTEACRMAAVALRADAAGVGCQARDSYEPIKRGPEPGGEVEG